MVTFTRSSSSPEGGLWLVGVGVALMGEMVRGEEARGKTKVGAGRKAPSQIRKNAFFRRAWKWKQCLNSCLLHCPQFVPLMHLQSHPLGSWCFPLTGCAAWMQQKGWQKVFLLCSFTENTNINWIFLLLLVPHRYSQTKQQIMQPWWKKHTRLMQDDWWSQWMLVQTYADCCGGCV